MSDKKNTDQPGGTDTDKKTAGTQGEGFAAKVDRLSGKTPETPAGEGQRSDAPDSNPAHEPVLVTDHPADSQAAPAVTQVIKKRSLAGLLGFLFGATALAGLGYWYYQQNGWQWPPAGSVARVKQADLHALETRLRQEWKSDLKQEIHRLVAQQEARSTNTETGPETTAAVNEKINALQARVDSLQQQLASLPTNLPTGEGSSPENGGAISKDTAEQLASLQNRLQQASEQIQALQQALAENREDTQAQLAQWQQQLETALNQAQSAGQNPLINPQAAQHLAQQLHLQQALNALDSAQLALNVQHQPRAAAVALEQAAEQLRPVPEAGQQLQAIQQALATLEAQQQRPDTLTPALAESAQAIANWHWQPPNNASDPSAENKKRLAGQPGCYQENRPARAGRLDPGRGRTHQTHGAGRTGRGQHGPAQRRSGRLATGAGFRHQRFAAGGHKPATTGQCDRKTPALARPTHCA